MDHSIFARRQWLAFSAAACITPVASLATIENGTITVAEKSFGSTCIWGYSGGLLGAYSPTGLTGGKTVAEISAIVIGLSCNGTLDGIVQISGFSSNPGQSWLTSVECNAITKTGATATFNYGSGIAAWSWSATSWGFPTVVGSQLGCTIVHN
jgi:hypothetical protein